MATHPRTQKTGSSIAASDGKSSAMDLRRMRKRELDRKAQRVARDRTKHRIAHLEGLVEELRQQDGRDSIYSLAQRLNQAEHQRDCSRRVLESIISTASKHLTEAADATETGAKQLDYAPASGSTTGQTPLIAEESEHAIQSDSHHDAPAAATAYRGLAQGTLCASETVPDQLLLNDAQTEFNSIDSFLSALNNDAFVSEGDSTSLALFSAPDLFCADLEMPPLSSKDCSCNSTFPRFRALFDGTTVHANIWRAANDILSTATAPKICSRSEDTLIRAILFGWASQDVQNIDHHWRAVRYIDEIGFSSCCQTERLAILWMVHLRLEFITSPSSNSSPNLPMWYLTPTQKKDDPPAVNYLTWPGVRQRFLEFPHLYCQNLFWYLFKDHFRIDWPFEFRDCYAWNVQEGQFCLSPNFKKTLYKVDAWRMEPPFFEHFPELMNHIPVACSSS
ncbi:hypothetical protein B0T10DRAFT_496549 [Thelonectria olida]|uniref:BZIP transcription factor n=1 Tax=Thelonectria olida TaxID=1576542 RepID=A0A9P8VUD7_9HYPO|nr:hypothetical protein B0T10DRAFT_496549 [Thelonectria olida]